MSQRPGFTLDDVPAIHRRQQKAVAETAALIAVAALQADLTQWLRSGDALVQQLAQRQTKARAVDISTDRAWGGIKRVLEGIQRMFAQDAAIPLTEEEAARAALAVEVERALIGDSLAFLKLSMLNQWREMDQRLRRLDEPLQSGPTLREALAALGLSLAVARLERLHVAYTHAVGLSDEEEALKRALLTWEDGLEQLEGGIRYFVKDQPQRDAVFSALHAPFIKTVEERKAAEAKAKRAADAKAAAEAKAADAAKPADEVKPADEAKPAS
jgi:hypothetical protein